MSVASGGIDSFLATLRLTAAQQQDALNARVLFEILRSSVGASEKLQSIETHLDSTASINFGAVLETEYGGEDSLLEQLMYFTNRIFDMPEKCEQADGTVQANVERQQAISEFIAVQKKLLSRIQAHPFTPEERRDSLIRIYQSDGTYSDTHPDVVAFMYQLIEAVLQDDKSSKDVTLAVFKLIERGRFDLVREILTQKRLYGAAVNPFAVDPDSPIKVTLAEKLRYSGVHQSIDADVCRGVMAQLKLTIHKKIVPKLREELPKLGVEWPPESTSEEEVGSFALQYVDCFGAPTATLLALYNQYDQGAVIVKAEDVPSV